MMLWIALVLGVVEGLTEFLPISSTGHLVLASEAMRFGGDRAELFEIFIQLGAILAVVWEYRRRLARAVLDLPRRSDARRFAGVILLAFLPAAALGFAVHDLISDRLLEPTPVALAMIAGAVLILVVEALPRRARTSEPERVTAGQALLVGAAQCLSLWPGFSRSAATIMGGLGAGLDRRAATEFSFFLAIPTMAAATLFSLVKYRDAMVPGDALWLTISFAVSFAVAWGSIRWLLRFVASHSFRIFAWYRIAVGVAVLWWVR